MSQYPQHAQHHHNLWPCLWQGGILGGSAIICLAIAMVGVDAAFDGNSPAWSLGTGLSRVNQGPTSELGQTGFSGFYDQPGNADSTTRRHFEERYFDTCPAIAEPSVTVAPQSAYYQRRKAEPDSYRPHLKQFPKPHYPEKPDRRKYIPDPNAGRDYDVAHGIRTVKVSMQRNHFFFAS